MEDTNNAIFNLMQNIVDKLESIENSITTKDEQEKNENQNLINEFNTKNKAILNLIKALYNVVENENKTNAELRKEFLNKLKEVELTPIVNQTTNEYSLFGNKSIFERKQLIAFIVFLVVVWSSIKYLPSFISENSEMIQKYENYEILTNYLYFNKETKLKNLIDKTYNKIQKKDTVFMNEYYNLMRKQQIELQRRKLQEELNSLEQ